MIDGSGRAMIARGAILEDFQIEYLQDKGIGGVYIREGEEDLQRPEEITVSRYTQEVIDKNRVEDCSRVKLSESVRKRVGEGIQYLYHNTDSDSFDQTAANVTNELMNAIFENDAVAVDIGLLKVSDEYTFKHSVDVATMAMIIGKKYGLTDKEIHKLGVAGLLHDVGKSRIPSELLNKPGALTDREYELMKQHSLLGFEILKKRNAFSDEILRGVLQHHEKMNGKGYPLGVKADKIHKYARIISVADVYDALVTERSYKKAFSQRDAVEIIMTMTADLDIEVMKSFLESVILYPVDSIVELSNGEKAKVVENSTESILRPKVVGLKSGKLYDLAGDVSCASVIIL